MKNISSIAIATVLGFSLFGCSQPQPSAQQLRQSAAKLNVEDVCNVQKHGVQSVLAIAEKYNPIAIQDGVEFKRLGMTTAQYIAGTKEALKDGSKTVTLMNGKKKTKEKVSVEFAAWRSCAFSVSALRQEVDAKKTWRLAVPGDGFKY
jgi:hypothetical protein